MNVVIIVIFSSFPPCKDVCLDSRTIAQEENCCNFIKKETLAQVFSREFCEMSNNTFFTEHLRETASVD